MGAKLSDAIWCGPALALIVSCAPTSMVSSDAATITRAPTAACRIIEVAAAALIQSEDRTPITVGPTPPMATKLDIQSFFRPMALDRELIAAFDQIAPSSASGMCAGVQAQLAAHSATVDTGRLEPGKPATAAQAAELRVGMPLLSPDGQAALVTMELQCQPYCGHGMTYYLRRTDNDWSIVSRRPEWLATRPFTH